MREPPEPHIEITLREIYDKLCKVERHVNEMRSEKKGADRLKLLMYPTWAAIVAALITPWLK